MVFLVIPGTIILYKFIRIMINNICLYRLKITILLENIFQKLYFMILICVEVTLTKL